MVVSANAASEHVGDDLVVAVVVPGDGVLARDVPGDVGSEDFVELGGVTALVEAVLSLMEAPGSAAASPRRMSFLSLGRVTVSQPGPRDRGRGRLDRDRVLAEMWSRSLLQHAGSEHPVTHA